MTGILNSLLLLWIVLFLGALTTYIGYMVVLIFQPIKPKEKAHGRREHETAG